MKAMTKAQTIKALKLRNPKGLTNPVIKWKENGKIESITGTCSKVGCKNLRTIHAADWHQVYLCRRCQLDSIYKRNAERAAERRAAKR